MSYRLVYTQKAVKDIGKLDVGVKKRIGVTLLRLKDNPLQYAEPLTDPELGGYRFRIGDYRVIFDMEGGDYRRASRWPPQRNLQKKMMADKASQVIKLLSHET